MNPFSNSSHQPEYDHHTAQKTEELLQSFAVIAALAEEEIRQQKIQEAAAIFELSETSYRQELELYLQNQNTQEQTEQKSLVSLVSLFKPVSLLDTKVSDFANFLQEVSVIRLAAVLGEGALLFAMTSYLVTIPSRHQQEVQKAREILLHAREHKYDKSRVTALQTLDQRCAGNPGLVAPQAYLVNLEIMGCSRWSFQFKSLTDWSIRSQQPMDLSYSVLTAADFSNAQLPGVNLAGSDLSQANLRKINLQGANLQGANLAGANLSRANLQGANLTGAILDGANLYGVNASEANFTQASLMKAQAPWSYFDQTNFYRANLKQINFNRSDLQDADFYKANLSNASLRFTNLQRGTKFFSTQLRGADFWGARWTSIFQIKQGKNWVTTNQNPQWQKQVTLAMLPALNIGLIKPQEKSSLFEAYELGMRRAANRRVDIWGFESVQSVKEEAATIDRMIELGMDAIILRPSDQIDSLPALKKASEAGLVVITVDSCLEKEVAEDLITACFDTDSERMGYDSGIYLTKWVKHNILHGETNLSQPIHLALVDSAAYDRNYPYLQGILSALDNSTLQWSTLASVGVTNFQDLEEVIELLIAYPEIEILWGGSNLATKVALEAVERLELGDRVAVFGILDLSQDQAQRLLDEQNPLQSIIDQSGVQTGQQATERAIAVLRGKIPGAVYHQQTVEHRLLTQEDREQVLQLLNEAGSLQE